MCPLPWASLRGSAPPAVPAASAWPGMTLPGLLGGLDGQGQAGQRLRSLEVLAPTPCCGILPLHARGGCWPWRLPALAVPREDSPGPPGHRSPGSTQTGTSPAHPAGTPGTGVMGQQHPPQVGDHTTSQPTLTSGWVALSLGRTWPQCGALLAGWTGPQPPRVAGGGGGPCPGCQPAPESHPVLFPSGAGRAGARTEAALCGVPRRPALGSPAAFPCQGAVSWPRALSCSVCPSLRCPRAPCLGSLAAPAPGGGMRVSPSRRAVPQALRNSGGWGVPELPTLSPAALPNTPARLSVPVSRRGN